MLLPHVLISTLAITGSKERFPVRRIYCVGRNYADHAREMGGDPARESPFFFSKPADTLVETGSVLSFPSRTNELHHEVEMVVALAQGGACLSTEQAAKCIFGFAVGIDLTRRDLQSRAKQAGRPWDLSKGFDHSAPVGALSIGPLPPTAEMLLYVDDEQRQKGDIKDMIWSVPEIIAELSLFVSLSPGDLVFTGTPAGVGPVSRGQKLHARLSGAAPLDVEYLT